MLKIKRMLRVGILVMLFLVLNACGVKDNEIPNTEGLQPTEVIQETETEFRVDIKDATDILTKTWDSYEEGTHFEIMGGHVTSAILGFPAKYDLAQTTDLVQMYCVSESQLEMIDDAGTMIDLYNAARFTAGVYHVSNAEYVSSLVGGIKNQVSVNEWHGEKPEKLLIIQIDEQYVISVYGRESLVNEFKQNLESVYKEMIKIMVEEKIF